MKLGTSVLLCVALFSFSVGETHAEPARSTASVSGQRGQKTQAGSLVASIQTLLTRAGFAPGPADGVMGARTAAAIRRFQAKAGMAVDGAPSSALYRSLTEYLSRVSPAARSPTEATAGTAVAPVRKAAVNASVSSATNGKKRALGPILLIGTVWRFMDASGASFKGRFEQDGTFVGPGEARFWSWQLMPKGLEIVFDDGMGVRVTREGRFVDKNWLNGSASSSTGRHWDWVANRVEPKAGR